MKAKTWFFAGAAVIILGVIAAIFWRLRSAEPVEVAAVQQGRIRQFVDERGETRLPETYLITMPVNGRIEPITLTEGDPVAKGKQVAQVVPEDLQLAVDRAEAVVKRLDEAIAENRDNALEEIALEQANQFVRSMRDTTSAAAKQVESARAKLDYSNKNLARIEGLRSSGASTKDELDRAELQQRQDQLAVDQDDFTYKGILALQVATDLMPGLVEQYIKDKDHTRDSLQKQKDEAQAVLDQARLDQQRGTITSPIDGVVLKRHVNDERFLAAGTPLLEVGRPEELEIEADVLSLDVVNVKKGQPVEIYGPAIGKRLPHGEGYARGTVHKIYPAGFTKISSLGVEQQRVKVIVRFDPEDLDWLRRERHLAVGYRVRVKIYTAEQPDALLIPRSALFRDADDNWNVYAVRNGRLRTQRVELGMINDELAAVAAGLAAGEVVVRAPEGDLEEGQRVKLVRNKSSGEG